VETSDNGTGEVIMTTARDVMHVGADCIKEEQTLAEAARMMRDLGVGALPICGSDDKLKGIITDRDIVIKAVAEGRDPSTCTARELEQGRVAWVESTTDVDSLVDMMGSQQVKRMPVIENHRLVGMVSEADLARHLDEHQLSSFVEKVYGHA
jgi:CBS domain-containing protein